MPRYFFNCHGYQVHQDQSGTNLPDDEVAKVEAARIAGEILASHTNGFVANPEWQLAVTDATGRTVLRRAFGTESFPAADQTWKR